MPVVCRASFRSTPGGRCGRDLAYCVFLTETRDLQRDGKRHLFVAGLSFFAAVSLVGGFSWEPWILVAARFLRGRRARLWCPPARDIRAEGHTEPGTSRVRGLREDHAPKAAACESHAAADPIKKRAVGSGVVGPLALPLQVKVAEHPFSEVQIQ